MPHTVPKRPMKGQAEAVVARKVMDFVSRDISTPIARSRARSIPEMFLMSSFPVEPPAVVGASSARIALTCASSSA